MPGFDRQLVQVAIAPNGILAASCIAWFDPITRWVEIEPLGTRPDLRRLGLARAVVLETLRRSHERGAAAVMVWGAHRNEAAIALYTSCGFSARRTLREYRLPTASSPRRT